MKKFKKSHMLLLLSIPILLVIVLFVGQSFAAPLESGTRVKENSDLTYYIDILYDGKDKDLVMSNDTTTAEVRSDYIYVEDKLPEGLIFKEFITTEDGTIGAVQRGDTSKSCSGYVVDGVDGLKYDATTRTVTFAVKNLQAGCKITVGVVTTTPSLGDKTRIDFYNTAFAREGTFSTFSNTVHAFMGEVEETLYTVNYEYTGDIPEGAPTPPESTSYSVGTSVGVNSDITLNGYTFSGWTTTDVTVTDGVFEMPASVVTFTGSFEKKPTYEVVYQIDGTSPEGYLPPTTKEYGEKDTVTIDSLESGNVINGYRFLGWETTDVTVEDGVFEMPSTTVTFTGKFERISYTVTYAFQGDTIPDNADTLLPAVETYYPGDEVTLAENPTTTGYKFLGWYYSNTFEMPEENITIYGEWMLEAGNFTPTISKEIINPQDYYQENEKIQFKVTVTNTADFAIKDVILQNHQEGSSFIANDNYKLMNDSFVQISSIPAKSSVDVYAEYIAGNDTFKTYTNTVTLDGALADNNYRLDTSQEYTTTSTFNVANIKLKIETTDTSNNHLEGVEYKIYSDSSKTNLIGTGTSFEKLTLSTTYYIEQTKTSSGYILNDKIIQISINENGIVTAENYNVTDSDGIAILKVTNYKVGETIETPNTLDKIIIYVSIFAITLLAITALSIYIYKLVKKTKKEETKNTDIEII